MVVDNEVVDTSFESIGTLYLKRLLIFKYDQRGVQQAGTKEEKMGGKASRTLFETHCRSKSVELDQFKKLSGLFPSQQYTKDLIFYSLICLMGEI